MPDNNRSPLRSLADLAIAGLSRRALLDWAFREQLVANPQEVLMATLGVEPELMSELEAVSRHIVSLSPTDLGQELWRVAKRSAASSSWKTLNDMMRSHVYGVKQLMFEIVGSLPSRQDYGDIVCEAVERWPASLLRTPSTVIWPLTIAQTIEPENMERVFPLAAACAFYYQGVVVFDDIADGELEPVCTQWPRGQVEHLAYTLAGALPFASLGRLDVPDSVRSLIVQDFVEAIWITNIGQYLDMRTDSPAIYSIEASERIAQHKTGIGISLLARSAAHCFEMDEEQVAVWTECAEAFATARQIASDVRDIWDKPVSPDLFSGKCTLPIAYALTQLSGQELEDFQTLRARCRYQHAPHAEFRLWMERLGALSFVEQRLDQYRTRGELLLDKAGPSDTARAWVMTWAGQASVFGDI